MSKVNMCVDINDPKVLEIVHMKRKGKQLTSLLTSLLTAYVYNVDIFK